MIRARCASCSTASRVRRLKYEIEAQAGKEITQAQAEALLADVARIRAVLAC
jgi:hypothetical protein